MDLKSLVAPKEDRSLPLTIRRNAYIHLGGKLGGIGISLETDRILGLKETSKVISSYPYLEQDSPL